MVALAMRLGLKASDVEVVRHRALLEGIDPTGELRLLDPELGPLRVEAKALQPNKDGDSDRLSILLLRRATHVGRRL